MKNISSNKQAGAVSLFVVIFAMLLITVITISFLRLMVNDQSQASDTDLSQSAYDSAQAGVEDAKRALLRYQQVCATDPGACASLNDAISLAGCNQAVRFGGVVSDGGTGEVQVQQTQEGNENDKALNQAYTCVTMKLATEDYVGTLNAEESQLVPLVGKEGFDTVVVNWYSPEDLTNDTGTVNLPVTGTGQPLVIQSQWPLDRPSILRTQLIQFGSSFTLDSFNYVNPSGESNANTLFLYPQRLGTDTFPFVGNDIRKTDAADDPDPDSSANTPLPVRCKLSISSGGYACSVALSLPKPIGGGDRTAYLRLSPLYNGMHYQVLLKNGGISGSPVRFKDVQPEIDSTGRANDLFKRIVTRVDLHDTTFPYPEGTIDVTGNFCKDFGVTDSAYVAGSCTP